MNLEPSVRAATIGSGYRYRGARRTESPAQKAEKVRGLLRENRQLLSFKSSNLRNVSLRMNEHIAQAFVDGVKIAALARAAQLTRVDVRRIALSFEDLYPSGTPSTDHLARIADLRGELSALEAERLAVEQERLQVIAQARRKGLLDDYELASLSGLNPAYVGKMTWGVSPQEAPLTFTRRPGKASA